MIRSAGQFTPMFNRLGRQGGTLRFAAGADLDLPAIFDRWLGPVSVRRRPGTEAAAPPVPRGRRPAARRRRTGP